MEIAIMVGWWFKNYIYGYGSGLWRIWKMFSTVFCCLLNGLNEWHLLTRGDALSVIKTRNQRSTRETTVRIIKYVSCLSISIMTCIVCVTINFMYHVMSSGMLSRLKSWWWGGWCLQSVQGVLTGRGRGWPGAGSWCCLPPPIHTSLPQLTHYPGCPVVSGQSLRGSRVTDIIGWSWPGQLFR